MFQQFAAGLLVACLATAQVIAAEPYVAFESGMLTVEMEDVELSSAAEAVSLATGVEFKIGAGIGGRLSKRFRDQPLDKGIGVKIGGNAHRNQPAFALFFDELKKDLDDALSS